MIYEFLYKDKPIGLFTPIIPFIMFLIFLGFDIYFYRAAHPQKQEPSTSATYRYDPELRKHVAVSTATTEYSPEPPSNDILAGIALSFLLSMLFGIITLGTSAISIYDYVTTPSKNTKTTDLYRTKTMEITYTSNDEYVIVTNHQAYKIPKEAISE